VKRDEYEESSKLLQEVAAYHLSFIKVSSLIWSHAVMK